jgi:AhpD family alkylhydroperoxidase
MTERLSNPAAHLHLFKPLIEFGAAAKDGIGDATLAELIEIRASQMNGCAVCLALHTRSARKNGETEERIFMLNAWRESHLFSERERAALGWTEALTRLDPAGVSGEAHEALAAQFTEDEQVRITLLIGAINAFNRMNVGFRVSSRWLAGHEKR